MGEDEEYRRYVLSRMFCLITAAAEDAAAIAASAQAKNLPATYRPDAAAKLRSTGETIEIIASAIELIEPRFVVNCGAEQRND
jgi:hypothetical protein